MTAQAPPWLPCLSPSHAKTSIRQSDRPVTYEPGPEVGERDGDGVGDTDGDGETDGDGTGESAGEGSGDGAGTGSVDGVGSGAGNGGRSGAGVVTGTGMLPGKRTPRLGKLLPRSW